MKGKARTSLMPSFYATSPGTSYLQPVQLSQPTQPAAETLKVAGSLPSARSKEFGSCAHHRLCADLSQLWQWFAMQMPVLREGGFGHGCPSWAERRMLALGQLSEPPKQCASGLTCETVSNARPVCSILANTEKHQWEQLTHEKQPGLKREAAGENSLLLTGQD